MFQTQAPIDAQTVNLLIQLGAVGVLFLLAFAVVLWIWTHRNVKPVDITTGTNAAIEAFAEMFDRQAKQIEADRELRKAENEATRIQNKELQQAYIESISANADATNRIADTVKSVADNQKILTELWDESHKTQAENTSIIKTTVQKMDVLGSEPLQRAIEVLSRVETVVNQIAAKQNEDRQYFTDTIHDALLKISDAKNALTKIEDKRSTGLTAAISTTVIVPEQELKVEVDKVGLN